MGHACGPIVLVCLVNNWPWPDHSNIASYGPEMFSDSISESVNLQNFLGGMPSDPPRFVCFAKHGNAFYYILALPLLKMFLHP